jgi:WD40 repeat protein
MPRRGRIRSLAFDGQGELLAAACGDGIVRFWRPSSGDTVTELASQVGWSRAIAVEPSGDRLAVGSGVGDIEVYEIATGDLLVRLAGHAGRILMLGFAGDGDRLVSAAADGTARSWSLADQGELAQVRVDASGQCAAFDATSGRLLLAGASGVTCLSLAE